MLVPLKKIPEHRWREWYFSMPVSEIATALRVKKKTILKHLKIYDIIKPGTVRRFSSANSAKLWRKKIK